MLFYFRCLVKRASHIQRRLEEVDKCSAKGNTVKTFLKLLKIMEVKVKSFLDAAATASVATYHIKYRIVRNYLLDK